MLQQLTELKGQPGKNITITGSGTLVWSLFKADLLDQLTLLMHRSSSGLRSSDSSPRAIRPLRCLAACS